MFGLFDFSSSEIERSFESLKNYFEAERNIGIPRFENDVYYRFSDDYNSNIWIISTLWQAEFYLAKGDKRQAERDIGLWQGALLLEFCQSKSILVILNSFLSLH